MLSPRILRLSRHQYYYRSLFSSTVRWGCTAACSCSTGPGSSQYFFCSCVFVRGQMHYWIAPSPKRETQLRDGITLPVPGKHFFFSSPPSLSNATKGCALKWVWRQKLRKNWPSSLITSPFGVINETSPEGEVLPGGESSLGSGLNIFLSSPGIYEVSNHFNCLSFLLLVSPASFSSNHPLNACMYQFFRLMGSYNLRVLIFTNVTTGVGPVELKSYCMRLF